MFGYLASTCNVQLKQTSHHIRNAVKYCVKTRYLNGKMHNGSERDKRQLEPSGMGRCWIYGIR